MVLSILFDGQHQVYHFNEGVNVSLLCLNLVRIGEMDLKREGGNGCSNQGWFGGMMKLGGEKMGRQEKGHTKSVELRQMQPGDC